MLGVNIYLDDSLEDGKIRTNIDYTTKRKMIFVAQDLYNEIVKDGVIPEIVATEIKKGQNGGSYI